MHGKAYQITVGSAANHLNQQFYSTHRQFDFYPGNPLCFNHNIIHETDFENI